MLPISRSASAHTLSIRPRVLLTTFKGDSSPRNSSCTCCSITTTVQMTVPYRVYKVKHGLVAAKQFMCVLFYHNDGAEDGAARGRSIERNQHYRAMFSNVR